MAVINSYYLYQKYEKRGNQPWIPCYPNTWSVDADGTMPPVLKQQDDPSCYHPIYRWVQTQDTICIDTTTIEYRTTSGTPYCTGYDKYVDTTYEQSFDGGVTWEFVSSSSTLVETDSEYCGYEPTPEVQYRWTESGTTCDNANKYKRYIKQVSYDGGEAWIVVNPPQYSAGTLVESDSYDCGYRTSATTSATYCSNANQYVDVYSLVSRDYGETWSTASTSTELIEEDVVECGFSARTISTATTCVGVDKHYLDEYQESRDTGTTWTTISSSTGSLIESQSTDCGYSATTVSSATYCSNANQYVDVYNIVSTDYGQTWITASTSTELVEQDSYDCGYRTRTTTGESYCDNANEYAYTYNEVSRDYGNTWTTASTSSVLVQSDSYDCGYRTGTTSSSTYCNGDDLYVDVYYRVSRDTGVTWTTASTTPTLVEAGGCATPTIDGKFKLTLSDASTVTAECDSTSAVTSGEVSSQYSGTVVSAEIGDCVSEISDLAFSHCTALTSVIIPDSVTSIGDTAFAICRSLTSVTIPSSVISISGRAFTKCTSLTSIDIPDSVTNIGEFAFEGCSGLTSCTIGNGVTNTGYAVFQNCTSLRRIDIPDSVTTIGYSGFRNCTSLTTVTIPNSVTNIGERSFQHCSGLTSIRCLATAPATLGSYAFDNTNNCPIYVPCESVSAYQTAWDSLVDTSRIQTLPNSDYQGIYSGALSNGNVSTIVRFTGSTLTSGNVSSHREDTVRANIGTAITEIDDNTFSGFTMLTEAKIASTVTTIGNNAFKDCPQMNVIIVNSTTPPTLGSNAFDGTNNCPIQVPCGYASAYKSASGWSTYASRII